MLIILQFIFSSFWIWLGSMFLITAIGSAISSIIRAFIPQKHYHVSYASLNDKQKHDFKIEYLKRVNDEQAENEREVRGPLHYNGQSWR